MMTGNSVLYSMSALCLSATGLAVYYFFQNRRLRKARTRLLGEKQVMFGYVHEVGEVFIDAENVDLDRFLRRVLYFAMRITHAAAGVIYMQENETPQLRVRAISGTVPPLTPMPDGGLEKAASRTAYLENLVRSIPVTRGQGLIGGIAEDGRPALIQDAERDVRIPRYDSDLLKIRSVLLVPMRFQNRTLGVIALINRTDGRTFTEGDLNMVEGLAAQTSVSAHFIDLREALEAKKRLDHDLDLARHIQARLLPSDIPQAKGFEIAAMNKAAQQIGGDYYDIISIDKTHLGLAIADVSGKGIAGALVMSSCRSVLRALAPGRLDPSDILRAMNHSMGADMYEDMFVSMLYMVLNTLTGEMLMARAGHLPPLIFRAETQQFEEPPCEGIAVGLSDSETFDMTSRVAHIQLKTGDLLVAYTDGITEAMNAEGEEWGEERFRAVIRACAGMRAADIPARIEEEIAQFVGPVEPYDDKTLLLIRMQ